LQERALALLFLKAHVQATAAACRSARSAAASLCEAFKKKVLALVEKKSPSICWVTVS